MSTPGSLGIDYKTHILIGVRESGVMTVIRDWPHLPRQAEVQREIDATRESYVTFLLCTPTSIMPVNGGRSGSERGKSRSHWRG